MNIAPCVLFGASLALSGLAATAAQAADDVVIISPQSGSTITLEEGTSAEFQANVAFNNGVEPFEARLYVPNGDGTYTDIADPTDQWTPIYLPYIGWAYTVSFRVPDGTITNVTFQATGRKVISEDPYVVEYPISQVEQITIDKENP